MLDIGLELKGTCSGSRLTSVSLGHGREGTCNEGPARIEKERRGLHIGNRAGQTCATSVRKATLSRSRKKTSAGRSRSAEKLRTRMPAPRPLPPVAPGTQQHPGPAPRLPAVNGDTPDSQRQPAAPAMAAGPSRWWGRAGRLSHSLSRRKNYYQF